MGKARQLEALVAGASAGARAFGWSILSKDAQEELWIITLPFLIAISSAKVCLLLDLSFPKI